jgi:flotillin
MDQAQLIGIALGIGTLVVIGVIVFFRYNIVICQPNELVIIAGRERKNKDGSTSGYRVIRGGRGFKWPIMESVARLPLTTVPLEVHLKSALSAGMIPLHVVGRANVKLAGRPEMGMEAAIERFLGKGPDAVVKTARQTLEGALRGVLAKVTPEQANQGRLELAKQVTEAAREDLRNLGIVLDYFQMTPAATSTPSGRSRRPSSTGMPGSPRPPPRPRPARWRPSRR